MKSFWGVKKLVADVPDQWCHHKISLIPAPHELHQFNITCVCVVICCLCSSESQVFWSLCTSVHVWDVFLELSGLFRWLHLMCMWLWAGIPLRPGAVGERRILSPRKATKLHLWSDKGLECHKQLLRRQPAVTLALEPGVLWQRRHAFKERCCES